jgi:hypothetical protein
VRRKKKKKRKKKRKEKKRKKQQRKTLNKAPKKPPKTTISVDAFLNKNDPFLDTATLKKGPKIANKTHQRRKSAAAEASVRPPPTQIHFCDIFKLIFRLF